MFWCQLIYHNQNVSFLRIYTTTPPTCWAWWQLKFPGKDLCAELSVQTTVPSGGVRPGSVTSGPCALRLPRVHEIKVKDSLGGKYTGVSLMDTSWLLWRSVSATPTSRPALCPQWEVPPARPKRKGNQYPQSVTLSAGTKPGQTPPFLLPVPRGGTWPGESTQRLARLSSVTFLVLCAPSCCPVTGPISLSCSSLLETIAYFLSPQASSTPLILFLFHGENRSNQKRRREPRSAFTWRLHRGFTSPVPSSPGLALPPAPGHLGRPRCLPKCMPRHWLQSPWG